MSAKDMFEKMGYKYQESYFKGKLDEIKYTRPNKFAMCVIFNLNHKCFKIFRFDDENKSSWCDMDLLQAINQQMKEIGVEE